MLFLMLNEQCQRTEGKMVYWYPWMVIGLCTNWAGWIVEYIYFNVLPLTTRPCAIHCVEYSDFHLIPLHSLMYTVFFHNFYNLMLEKNNFFILNFRRVWRDLVNVKFCQFQIQGISERYVLRYCFGLLLVNKFIAWLSFIYFNCFQCQHVHPAKLLQCFSITYSILAG